MSEKTGSDSTRDESPQEEEPSAYIFPDFPRGVGKTLAAIQDLDRVILAGQDAMVLCPSLRDRLELIGKHLAYLGVGGHVARVVLAHTIDIARQYKGVRDTEDDESKFSCVIGAVDELREEDQG